MSTSIFFCFYLALINFSCTLTQRIKGNQIQKQIREEMDVLADHVTSLNTHRETQTQLVKKLEEREKALQNAVVWHEFLKYPLNSDNKPWVEKGPVWRAFSPSFFSGRG